MGKKVKLEINVIKSPTHIIRPKSIIGFIPLKYKVKKAKIVVSVVNIHGLIISDIFWAIRSTFDSVSLILIRFRYLTIIWIVIDKVRININEIKLDEITVTFQLRNEIIPVIMTKANIQLDKDKTIHLMSLKIK
jgi:hypothetical protein